MSGRYIGFLDCDDFWQEPMENQSWGWMRVSIYIFNQDIGRVTDNADHMRIYLEQTSGETSTSFRYIFLEIPEQKEINKYTKAGIDEGQLVSMYRYLTDNYALKPSIKTEKKLEELKESLHYTAISRHESEIWLVKDGFVIATILLDKENKDYFWGICYFSYTKLIRMEVYTDRIVFGNSYITATSENGLYAKLAKRTFYNHDGSVAYDQIFEGEEESFLFPDGRVYNKSEFVSEFIKKLDFLEQDVILLDDSVPNEFIQAIFKFGKKACIVVMMGSNKCDLTEEKDYYYWFQYSEALDAMIVPTEDQKTMLVKELKKYHCSIPDIRVFPMEGEFIFTVLNESYDGNLALSWTFTGKPDGFLIYDEFGTQIYETRNTYQHYFLIKGYEKKTGFVLKAFSDTIKGKVVIAESKLTQLRTRQYEKPIVSLVIPAYNAEDYIARTIDNALAQTFSQLEIIIVDDGSTDSTSTIIDWYIEKYVNVMGIHKENGGTPAARNTGIEHAQGQYIGFMDNDDMIRPEMMAKLYGSAVKHDCDIAVTSVYTITNTGYIGSVQYEIKEDTGISADEFFRIFMQNSELGVAVWNKLYRASLIKKYEFPIMPYDDLAWTPYILLYAEKICYLNGRFYEWDRVIRNSTLLSEWDCYKKEEMFEFRKKAILFFMENGNSKKHGLLKALAKTYLLWWEKIYAYEEYRKLWKWIDEQF